MHASTIIAIAVLSTTIVALLLTIRWLRNHGISMLHLIVPIVIAIDISAVEHLLDII